MSAFARWSIRGQMWKVGPILLAISLSTSPAVAQTIRGRLVDASSGKPVAAAELSLLAGVSDSTVVKRGLTTDSGSFSFTTSAGRYRLRAQRIGYQPVTSPPFDLVASEPLEVELKISVQAVPLSPLVVVSQRPPLLTSLRLVTNGFFDREQKWGAKGLGLGTFFDKEAIERRQPPRVSDLLRGVPGVEILTTQGHKQWVRMKRITHITGGPCRPVIYLDGIPLRTTGDTAMDNANNIDDLVLPSSVAGIEVYPGNSKPGEFTDMGLEACGAVVIWTGWAGRARKGKGISPDAVRMLGNPPRENENTKAAQRLLDQADSLDDKTAARPVYREALDAAQAAIASDSTNPLPRLQAGEAAIGVGDYEQADKQLDMAERLRPLYELRTRSIREKAWVDLQQKAAPLVGAGQYEEAIAIYGDANTIYRERPEAMLALGQLYGQQGKDDRALANLDSAALIIQDSSRLASVDPTTVADWTQRVDAIEAVRAQVLAHAGRYDEAVAQYQKLVLKHPAEVGYKQALARLLVQTEKYGEATQIYTEMLQDTALAAADLYQIGVGFYQMSDCKGAVNGFSGAAAKRPKDRDALEMWTRCLAMDSVYAQVPGVAERWIALDPNNAAAYMLEAQAVNRQGDGGRADELVTKIQDLNVTVDHLNIQRGQTGGAAVAGTMTNKALASGARVSITFTFYDGAGDPVGTQSQTVTMGAPGAPQDFTVVFESDIPVGGYGYTLKTP